MATEPPTTTTYNFPLIPPQGETDSANFEGEWGHLLNEGNFSDGTNSTDTEGLIAYLDALLRGDKQEADPSNIVVGGGLPQVQTVSDLPDPNNVREGTQYYVIDEQQVYVVK